MKTEEGAYHPRLDIWMGSKWILQAKDKNYFWTSYTSYHRTESTEVDSSNRGSKENSQSTRSGRLRLLRETKWINEWDALTSFLQWRGTQESSHCEFLPRDGQKDLVLDVTTYRNGHHNGIFGVPACWSSWLITYNNNGEMLQEDKRNRYLLSTTRQGT